SQIIEADTALIRGSLNGTVDFRNLQRTPAFVSDLKVSDIFYQMHPVGDIQLKADNLSANKYSAQLTLKGFENDVQLKGYYSNEGTSNALDFKADIVKLNLQTVEPFTFGQLRRSSGYLTGDFKVAGTIKQPIITGGVSFKNAAFNVAYLNNYLQLKDERISIDQHGIYFKSFTVLDSLGQKASLTGAVYTSDFKKMKFDLAVRTDNFTVLNTTIQDNSLYFGQLILSSDIRISGNEALPVIKADLKLLKGSNIAVVIPSSKISVDRGEGVVVLTDTATNYSIMQAKDTTVLITGLKGVNVSANIEVTKQTSFKLIVDKTSGDSLVVRGDGLLSFNMDESGNQNLTGTYVLDNGGYKATFQKIIKRELKIQQGGTITWNGSPLDAIVDITAAYSVRTPPADLLSSELASSTTDERNAYQKPILFSVLMSMKGQLLKPDITFKLDMADQDKDAYGGVVYAKINSLNNDPSELNKQVFALLIMNKFIPAGVGGNVDYGSAATSLARNSLNQILTDQLNRLSGKFIKGVDVNFGIRANDDYTSSGVQQNTEVSVGLKKQFFKDRLSVQVGTSVNVQNNNGSIKGADANSLTGDIVVEYKINKDGTLRFKAFRENEYEGIIDGSLYKTGVGLVLNKDYNTVKELFKSKKKAKKEAAQKQAGE
ncbi:MAG: hypothetical protein JWQ57_2669, partial [Mucilaginibacter sp.]|nr:hypothetical protein [Mucilaginibacter sp.]